MLFSIIGRSVTRITLHRFYGSLAANNYTLLTNQRPSKNSVLQCITLKHNAISHRHIFNTKNELTKFLPLLPGYVYKSRSVIETLAMILLERLTLRPMLDPEFDIRSVSDIMRKAACKVSRELAKQNYEALEGLVDENALKLLKERIDNLTEKQRELIAIRLDDLIDYTPAYIRVKGKYTSEDEESYIFTVEMNLLIYYRRGHRWFEKQFIEPNENEIPEEYKLSQDLVANYIFVRDYTKNGGSDWTIKFINIDTRPFYAY